MSIEERKARIREMWEAGKTGGEIGETLGITRSAAIGVIHRMGLKRDMSTKQSASLGGRVKRAKMKAATPPNYRVKKLTGPPVIKPAKLPPEPPPPPVEPRMVHLTKLKNGECRWPFGDGPFLFCAHPAKAVYCRYHAKVAYREPSK